MKLGEIIGHGSTIELLQRARRGERLPHALLLHGPEGVGKGSLARAFATALLCERDGDDACGECNSCRKIEHRNHPDLLVIRRLPRTVREAAAMTDAPADESAKDRADLSAQIRVFQIRQLIQHAAFAPRESAFRVFLVDPADRMNHESQNALLKTLEEPPGRSILMLISSNPHLLLTTVRSRCLSLGLAPLSSSALAAELQARGMDAGEATARAALAGGRPGRAFELDPETLRARRDAILDALQQLAQSPAALGDLAEMVQVLGVRSADELLDGLELAEALLRDAARLAAGIDGDGVLMHHDRAGELAELGRRLGAARAGELVHSVERLRRDLRFNVNRTLVAETLLASVAGGGVR